MTGSNGHHHKQGAPPTAHSAAPCVRPGSMSALWLPTLLAVLLSSWLLATAPPADAARKVLAPSLKQRVNVARAQHYGLQIATWYGPGFFGNRTGCGSTLRTRTWGIAHRSLPCGTLVWLRHRGREVAVPVIDRGPFSGASVDLTSRTARHLRFAGAGSVRMTVLRRRAPRASW